MDSPSDALKSAVERLHNRKATFRSHEWVEERFEEETVWRGDVFVLAITSSALTSEHRKFRSRTPSGGLGS